MQIRYQISEDDLAAVIALSRRKLNSNLRFFQVVGGIALVYLLYSISIGTASLRSWPGGVLPTVLVVLPFWINYQSRKAFRSNFALQEPRKMIVDSSGVSIESPSMNTQTAWFNYVSFVEDKRSFALVQQGKQTFIPIPKRELSAAEIQELRSLFETHIGRK